MVTMDDAGLPLEHFIQALTSQLDRAQATMALKARAGLPLTFAVKDLTLDLRTHVEMVGSVVRLRPAGPGDRDASTLHVSLTTITRPMIEENTSQVLATSPDEPSIKDVLGADVTDEEQRRLEWAGVYTVSQLRDVEQHSGAEAIERVSQLDVGRLRRALQMADQPYVSRVVAERPEVADLDDAIRRRDLTELREFPEAPHIADRPDIDRLRGIAERADIAEREGFGVRPSIVDSPIHRERPAIGIAEQPSLIRIHGSNLKRLHDPNGADRRPSDADHLRDRPRARHPAGSPGAVRHAVRRGRPGSAGRDPVRHSTAQRDRGPARWRCLGAARGGSTIGSWPPGRAWHGGRSRMNARSLATPWAHDGAIYSSPTSVILKLALGEAPDEVPVGSDVRARVLAAPESLGVGSVDRVLNHFCDDRRVTRIYSAAASRQPGWRHRGYDHLEQTIGLARTFRIDTGPGAPIADIVDALRSVAQAETVSPEYVSVLPFADPVGFTHIEPEALSYDESWQPRDQVNASQAAAYETGDPTVILAIVDTGVMADHRELRGRMRPGLDTVRLSSSDVAHGVDLVGDHAGVDTDTSDEVGHGTSCAAIAAASGDEIPPGMASGCSVLPMRVLGAAKFPGKTNRVGIGGLSDIDSGMKRAVDIGAKVINMSFGTPLSALDPVDPIPHQDIVRYALARGCVLIAASGNTGEEEGFTPAALDGVIAVGAIDPDGVPCRFSTTGSHVAVAAPGHRIATATLDGYGLVTGTSFAAPFVAAAAALLVSRAERRAYPMDGATAAHLLKESAVPWPAGRGEGHGAGILDALGALRLLDHDMDRAPPDD